MKANRIILIIIFWIVGYLVFFRGKEGPIGKFWTTIVSVFEPKKTKISEKNPYKSPEPTNEKTSDIKDEKNEDNVASAEKKNETKAEVTSVFDKIKDIFSSSEDESDDETTQIPDFALPAIQKGDQIVRHPNYILKYDEDFEQAAWIAHKLRGEYTRGKATRSGADFIPDKKVKTRSALSSDYSGSGYDRGHMVPAGDFKCCQKWMNETFYMSNMSPQNPDLNRYLWENIESRMRGWAVRDEELFIVTGPVLRKGLEKIGRYNKVSVPEFYYKIALFYQPNSGKKPRAIAFLVPNQAMVGKRMNNFVVTIDELEEKTGIDFFAKLPNEIESNVEAMNDWEAWTKIQF